MFDFFAQKSPNYQKASATPQQPSPGMLSSFWCYLFGDGTAICYRCKDDGVDGSVAAAVPTVAPRRWSAIGRAPAYRTARRSLVPAVDSGDAESIGGCGDSDVAACGDSDAGPIDEVYIE